MSKMGSHDPFGHFKHKFGQKKCWESNCQFDSWPLKVGNRPDFLACRWHATYHWKIRDEGYNFALNLISIEGFHAKLWAPKLQESQLWEFLDSHLGVPRQNDIWVLVLWPGIEYTIRGKVVASPKSESWWVYVCSCLIRAPRFSNYTLTNLWFGLCRSVWVIDVCHFS